MTSENERLGMIVTDLHQRIVEVDDHYTDMVGRSRKDLIGKLALSFTHDEDLQRNRPLLKGLITSGQGYILRKRYVRGDGSLVWVRNHVVKVSIGSDSPLLVAACQRVARTFGSEELTRNYALAKRLCTALVVGREEFTADIVSAPAIETVLWLYRAEIEGRQVDVDELARSIETSPLVLLRWIRLLAQRGLVEQESDGPLGRGSIVRISGACERALDRLLTETV